MTVPATIPRVSYIGTGAVSSYGYGFRVRQPTDLRVVVLDLNGDETLLVLGVDYTLTGINLANGGLVGLVNSGQPWLTVGGNLILDYEITFRRVLALGQGTSIRNQKYFYADVHEDAFDGFTMVDQQQADDISRAVKFPDSTQIANFDPTLPAGPLLAGAVLAVNQARNGWDMSTTISGIVQAGQTLQFLKPPASGARDGVNTTFALQDVPIAGSMVLAVVDGTIREVATILAGVNVSISAGLATDIANPSSMALNFLYLHTAP